MSTKDNLQKELIKKLRFGPSRKWINTYFDLVKQVIDITGLQDDDPRLAMPLTQSRWHFPVLINSRYVIASVERKTKNDVGLILAPYCRDIPELKHRDELLHFRSGNSKTTPPCFLRFDDLHEVVSLLNSSKEVMKCWRDALIAETNRAKGSRHRSSHRSIIYKLVTNNEFRNDILNAVYPEDEPSEKADNYVQYHNSDATGVSYLELKDFVISTSKPSSKLKGNRVWLIGGTGKPREYYLCYNFLVDQIKPINGDFKFNISGQKGVFLKPPILLNNLPWFKDFLKSQQNFSMGLRKIDNVFVPELEKVVTSQTVQNLRNKKIGGGLGDSETNKKVEQAAISFVTSDYQKRGWTIKSVESEGRGFDLLCEKGKLQEHVEVKGVQGNMVSFIITAGEVKKSRLDDFFILYVVTLALSSPKLHRFSAKEFQEKFSLETISYRASLKPKS